MVISGRKGVPCSWYPLVISGRKGVPTQILKNKKRQDNVYLWKEAGTMQLQQGRGVRSLGNC